MSTETELTFDQEMENLTEQWGETVKKAEMLDRFFFSDQFYKDHVGFGMLLGEFQRTLITLTGTYLPYLGLQQQQQTMPNEATASMQEELTEKSKLSGWADYRKIVVAVISLVLCYAAVDRGWLTINAFYWFLVAVIGLLSLPNLITVIHGLWKSHHAEEESPIMTPLQLEKMIQETLTEMSRKYLAFRKFILVQSHGEQSEYKMRGLHPTLYVRIEKEKEDLPHEFSRKINNIVTHCNTNIWERRTTIIWAMVQVRQAHAALMARSSTAGM